MSNDVLKIKYFLVDDLQIGDKCLFENHHLYIPSIEDMQLPDIVESLNFKILKANDLHVQTNTIMDVIPISTKVLGKIGSGITHTLANVNVIMCGAIEDGEQLHEFGSSEGFLDEHIKLNKPGTINDNDYVILVDYLLKKGTDFNRQNCLILFEHLDLYIQQIREVLKMVEGKDADHINEYINNQESSNRKRVLLVKQVAGQGCMYDSLLFMDEPSGYKGGKSIIDMENMPIFLTPNEYRDGILRAMS